MGSKEASGVFQAIIAQMPPHDVYIETHIGGGAIMRFKPRAAREIGIDRDRAAVLAFPNTMDCQLVIDRAETFLHNFDFASAGRVLVYADPPYVHATRTGRGRYRFEYTDDDHRALIRQLRALPANVAVMISGYPSALYDELVGDWRHISMQAMTRGGARTEKVWMNFPAGEVHGCEFAGAGRTKRQHIKRMAERWRARYAALTPPERLAVLSRVLSVHAVQPGPVASAAVAAKGRARAKSKKAAVASRGVSRRPLPAIKGKP